MRRKQRMLTFIAFAQRHHGRAVPDRSGNLAGRSYPPDIRRVMRGFHFAMTTLTAQTAACKRLHPSSSAVPRVADVERPCRLRPEPDTVARPIAPAIELAASSRGLCEHPEASLPELGT